MSSEGKFSKQQNREYWLILRGRGGEADLTERNSFLCYSMYCLFCVVLCTVCVSMGTVLVPPGGDPIAVNKYVSIEPKIV
jgi:hypothetical protein